MGSLASNSLAQASNREYVTKPLTERGNSYFRIFRAVPNRDWPGEANVHFAALYLSRQSASEVRLAQSHTSSKSDALAVSVATISSYLDEYPDFDLVGLPSEVPSAWQGFILRGNFSIHRQPDESPFGAIEQIPESERDALAGYLNTHAIQRKPRPTPPDVVIDFFEPIRKQGLEDASSDQQREWLEENYPVLLDQLQSRSPHAPDDSCVYEQRMELEDSQSNLPHKERWWLFGSVRHGLRDAWEEEKEFTAFPRVTKIWSPLRIQKHVSIPGAEKGLRICPMDKIFVAPKFRGFHLAVCSSFLFEMFTRRRCGTLKSDLNFSPTDVFPYFPWPWKPEAGTEQLTIGEPPNQTRESLKEAVDELLDLRTDILENPNSHGLSRSVVGGPTDLYNLYDADPERDDAPQEAASSAIEKLRQAHVDLLDAVLRAYGWTGIANDLSREDWTFDRPWLDRTQRFVPPEPVRAELFSRLDDLNSERFELERDMMIGLIGENLPEDGLTKTDFREEEPFSEMPIDEHQFEAFMEHEEQKMGDSRVKKEGYRWYAN